jgi:hypothetical protein
LDLIVRNGEVQAQTVPVALGMSGIGSQGLEHLGELVDRCDEDEEAQCRQLLEPEQVSGGDRGATVLGGTGVQLRVVDNRQRFRSAGGEPADRLGAADRVHMGEPLCVQVGGRRGRVVHDQPGVDEARGEEVLTEVDRLRVQSLGRLIGTDERDLSVRISQRRRKWVDTAVNISTKVHSHSRQATPSAVAATPVSGGSGIVT